MSESERPTDPLVPLDGSIRDALAGSRVLAVIDERLSQLDVSSFDEQLERRVQRLRRRGVEALPRSHAEQECREAAVLVVRRRVDDLIAEPGRRAKLHRFAREWLGTEIRRNEIDPDELYNDGYKSSQRALELYRRQLKHYAPGPDQTEFPIGEQYTSIENWLTTRFEGAVLTEVKRRRKTREQLEALGAFSIDATESSPPESQGAAQAMDQRAEVHERDVLIRSIRRALDTEVDTYWLCSPDLEAMNETALAIALADVIDGAHRAAKTVVSLYGVVQLLSQDGARFVDELDAALHRGVAPVREAFDSETSGLTKQEKNSRHKNRARIVPNVVYALNAAIAHTRPFVVHAVHGHLDLHLRAHELRLLPPWILEGVNTQTARPRLDNRSSWLAERAESVLTDNHVVAARPWLTVLLNWLDPDGAEMPQAKILRKYEEAAARRGDTTAVTLSRCADALASAATDVRRTLEEMGA